jgi:protein gp37
MATKLRQNQTTGIEWTDHTWNPFVGCDIHSDGCKNCYAMQQAGRIESFGNKHYEGLTKKANGRTVWTGRINRNSDRVWQKPYELKVPSLIFTNSMSDFFHPGASDDWRLEALCVMAECHQHQFQVLTKRPEEIEPFRERHKISFPENLWLGVTVEHQKTTHRIGTLQRVKFVSGLRFISFEPLLGPIDPNTNLFGIDWVISGGESGPRARPMEIDWLRGVDALAKRFKVPHFGKQFGKAKNNPLYSQAPKGMTGEQYVAKMDPEGKGGSLIDGRYIKEWPRVGHLRDQDQAPQRSLI